MLILRQFRLHNLVCHHKVGILQCIWAFDQDLHWDKEIYCPGRLLQYNLLHHFRLHNRDNHRNESSLECRGHWHNEIDPRDMVENLKHYFLIIIETESFKLL